MRILPLFIPHQGCPFNCVYCNQFSITHSSEISLSYFQKCIEDFCRRNLTTEEEIAFFGGTFTAIPEEQQEEYFQLVSPYLSQLKGIRISTRPDALDPAKYTFLKNNGVSTIELGIQSFNSEVLKLSGRGYTSSTAITACQEVMSAGFDLVIQLMPGLPGDKFDYFMDSLKETARLKPQGIRLYPTIVLKGTALEKWYLEGNYKPLELDETINWLKVAHQFCKEEGISIIKTGLHSDINSDEIVAGPYHPAIGELVQIELLYDELINKWQSGTTLSIPLNKKSLFLGHGNKLINKLKNKLLLDKIAVTLNKDQKDIEYSFVNEEAQYYW